MIDLDGVFIGLLRKTNRGLVEVDKQYSNYKRIEMTSIDWACVEIDGKDYVINANEIRFPISTNPWGIVSNFGIYDGEGNLLLIGDMSVNRFVEEDIIVCFSQGMIQIALKALEVTEDG